MVLLSTIPDHVIRSHLDDDETYLLPTVRVLVHAGRNSDYARGIVAWASQHNMITEKLRRECNLPLCRISVPSIRTVAGNVIEVTGQTRIKISPHFNEERTEIIDVLVAKKINTRLSADKVHPIARANLSSLQLADPGFDEPGEVDLVLGAPHIPFLMKSGSRSIYGALCYAKETTLGWIVMGRVPVEDVRHGPLPQNLVFI